MSRGKNRKPHPSRVRRVIREGIANGYTNAEIDKQIRRFCPDVERLPTVYDYEYYRVRDRKTQEAIAFVDIETRQLKGVRKSHRIRMLRDLAILCYNRAVGIVPGIDESEETADIIKTMHSGAIDVDKLSTLIASILRIEEAIKKEMASYEEVVSSVELQQAGQQGLPGVEGVASKISLMAMLNDALEHFYIQQTKEQNVEPANVTENAGSTAIEAYYSSKEDD